MKRIALLFLLAALPAHAQTSIPVKNPSFELTGPMGQPVAGWGAWNNGPLTGWVQAGVSGAFQPALTVPDGKTIAWSNGGTLSQDLGIPLQPNTTYTLKVYVAHLTGGAAYTLALNAGTANLCSSNGSTDSIPAGTFALETLTCPTGATVPAGNLSIVLGSGGVQVEFDNVSLTSTSLSLTDFGFVGALRYCKTCDGTDDTSQGMSVYTGAKVDFFEGPTLLFSTVLDAFGNFVEPVTGLDLSQTSVNLNVQISTPAGTFMNGISQTVDTAMLKGMASIHVTIGLDITTTQPRSLHIWTAP